MIVELSGTCVIISPEQRLPNVGGCRHPPNDVSEVQLLLQARLHLLCVQRQQEALGHDQISLAQDCRDSVLDDLAAAAAVVVGATPAAAAAVGATPAAAAAAAAAVGAALAAGAALIGAGVASGTFDLSLGGTAVLAVASKTPPEAAAAGAGTAAAAVAAAAVATTAGADTGAAAAAAAAAGAATASECTLYDTAPLALRRETRVEGAPGFVSHEAALPDALLTPGPGPCPPLCGSMISPLAAAAALKAALDAATFSRMLCRASSDICACTKVAQGAELCYWYT